MTASFVVIVITVVFFVVDVFVVIRIVGFFGFLSGDFGHFFLGIDRHRGLSLDGWGGSDVLDFFLGDLARAFFGDRLGLLLFGGFEFFLEVADRGRGLDEGRFFLFGLFGFFRFFGFFGFFDLCSGIIIHEVIRFRKAKK